MAFNLIGGLELIVKLLKSTNSEVLTSICAVVAKLASDEEILGVLTELGVVPLLAGLTNTVRTCDHCKQTSLYSLNTKVLSALQ